MKYGLANLRNERPEESIAVISVLLASLEVKKITGAVLLKTWYEKIRQIIFIIKSLICSR